VIRRAGVEDAAAELIALLAGDGPDGFETFLSLGVVFAP
jgi:hypothetical protein